MRYRAFISYSHADEAWARWLMRRLEGYRVPRQLVGKPGRDGPITSRLGKVFRDRDELPSAVELGSTINAALQDSQCLVVICSPTAAQSRWVNAEIEFFRANGRGDRIFSVIVGGDPASRAAGQACFPPALVAPEVPGGPPREPLAADARKEGDGRERALLKLVAGFLGVGYDDLARREAQVRHRRMAMITAAALAGMTIAIGLAATAYVARNDAERRQAQAEDILDFMLGDLRKNLTKAGRLDLMRSVDDKATGYFATLNPRDLSDRTLEAQARSLIGIGEVRFKEGNHQEAMTAFREAHARTTALFDRDPAQGQRLFDLAQSEYWIGFVAYRQGNYDQAELWLTRYRDSGAKLAAMDRGNFAWQKEQAYGYQNLAVLKHSQGSFDAAIKAMTAVRNLYADWIQEFPDDLPLREEDGNNASWLGNIALVQGNLTLAESYYSQHDLALAENIQRDPGNARWKSRRLDSLLLLLDAQLKLGKYEQARANNATALQIAHELNQHDPGNNGWRAQLGVSMYWQSALASTQQLAVATDAVATLKKAHAVEPKNERISRWLARALVLQGQFQLASGDTAHVAENVREARQLVEPFWQSKPNEQMRLTKVQTLILEAELFQKTKQHAAATAALESALKLLFENQKNELLFGRLDDAVRVLQLLGQEDRARPYQEKLKAAGFVALRRSL